MLLYDNRARLRILLQIHGSVYKRICTPLVMCSIYCTGLFFLFREFPEHVPKIEHPFASQSFGTLIAFAVCFRVNIAWNRFWEACQEVTMMFSKWSDAYAQLQGFVNSTIKIKHYKEPDNHEIIDRLNHARCEITHMFTVLSAVAVERLIRGDISRMEMRRAKGVPWREQVVVRQNLRNKDLTGSKNLIPFKVVKVRQQSDLAGESCTDESSDSDEQSDGINGSGMLPRSQTATKSFWCVAPTDWSDSAHRFRDTWETPVSVVGQLSKEEMAQLRASKDRPGLVLLWLGELVTDLQPYLIVPPPILSRVYQEISNGALGYSQALKLSDLPFPFIFAQALAVAVVVLAAISPIALTVITGDSWITPLLSTGVVLSFWGLNEIAKELENPFGEDPNDLPLYDAHERFTEHIVELHGSYVPMDRGFMSKKKERFSIYEQQKDLAKMLGAHLINPSPRSQPHTPVSARWSKSHTWHESPSLESESYKQQSDVPGINKVEFENETSDQAIVGCEDLSAIVPSIRNSDQHDKDALDQRNSEKEKNVLLHSFDESGHELALTTLQVDQPPERAQATPEVKPLNENGNIRKDDSAENLLH